jgi:DNA-binding transcriptional LysR family regulator
VRLFIRNTRKLFPTEYARHFYPGAKRVLEAISASESRVSLISTFPRGTIGVAAPVEIGRRFIADGLLNFQEKFPDVQVRLRISQRPELIREGIDVTFLLGQPKDSSLRLRAIIDLKRVLVASPAYLKSRGAPRMPQHLLDDEHSCLLLRFPGVQEHCWPLQIAGGTKKFLVRGPFDCDDGDVLTDWALNGHGIINKPRFEVEPFIRNERLVVVLPDTPPTPTMLAAVFPHRHFPDPKVNLLLDYLAGHCRRMINQCLHD